MPTTDNEKLDKVNRLREEADELLRSSRSFSMRHDKICAQIDDLLKKARTIDERCRELNRHAEERIAQASLILREVTRDAVH